MKPKPLCRRCKTEIPEARLVECRGYCKRCHAFYCATCERTLPAGRRLLSTPQRYFCEQCWERKQRELQVITAEVRTCLGGLVGEIRKLKERRWTSVRIAAHLDRSNPYGAEACGMSVTPRQVDVLFEWSSIAGCRPPWVAAFE
jgi:hypothetical protein